MKYLGPFSIFIVFAFNSCDPAHHLYLVNGTNQTIQVLNFPPLDSSDANGHVLKTVEVNGQEMSMIFLPSTHSVTIGYVTSRYTPRSDNIFSDFIEIRTGQDTITLASKDSIFSKFKKNKELDWRLTIK
jgi:hypothetical protein